MTDGGGRSFCRPGARRDCGVAAGVLLRRIGYCGTPALSVLGVPCSAEAAAGFGLTRYKSARVASFHMERQTLANSLSRLYWVRCREVASAEKAGGLRDGEST